MHQPALKLSVTAALLLCCAATAPGQDWSDAQKDVWKTVQGLWRVWQKEDVAGSASYMHPDFSSWNYRDDLPETFSKTETEAVFKMRSLSAYELKPLTIKVYDNFAFVHYRYSSVTHAKSDGREQKVEGRYTDILIKQNGRW